MSIAPFSFRDFGDGDGENISGAKTRPFLPNGRKKEEAPPPPPPPPTFNEEELKAAERDSYQKGFLAGIEEGKQQAHTTQAEIDAALTDMVTRFSGQFTPLFAIYRDMLKIQAEELPRLAYGIARKVAGDALQENTESMVADMCNRCLQTLRHEPSLRVIIHESLVSTLQNKLSNTGGSSDINIVGDKDIAPANFRIEWAHGSMIRDTESLYQQIAHVVDNMAASGAQETEALCDSIEKQAASIQTTPTAAPQENPASEPLEAPVSEDEQKTTLDDITSDTIINDEQTSKGE